MAKPSIQFATHHERSVNRLAKAAHDLGDKVDPEDIARRTGITVATVKYLLGAERQAFRAQLGKVNVVPAENNEEEDLTA